MIEKLKTINPYDETEIDMDTNSVAGLVYENTPLVQKINELVDAVNAIQKEKEAEWFEIKEWIGILEAVRKSVNIHEKQIDELQMKVEPEKCETPADQYAEQRKWIGKLCRFRDKDYKDDQWDYGLLQAVEKAETAHIWKTGCFKHNLGHWYDFCEPVKPDDDIIYKGVYNE